MEPNCGCWLWAATYDRGGYGTFYLQGKLRKAHRVAYEHFREPIPEGLCFDHLCRVRGCVNPWHGEIVTHAENVRRGESGKHLRDRTHCPRGHPYEGENLQISAAGRRHCRICRRNQTAKSRQNMSEWELRLFRHEDARRARERRKKKAAERPPRTHCKYGHLVTPENTVVAADGRKRCKECIRRRSREFQRQKRQGAKSTARDTS